MSYIPILILAHPYDRIALRVYVLLHERHGPEAIRIVSDEELIYARSWKHYIEGETVQTEIELADGARCNSNEIGVVLNRLRLVDPKHFSGSQEADLHYAIMETHALWLSWLSSLPCPVINPATSRGLSAPERGEVEWLTLAGRVGLPTRGWQLSTNVRRFYNDDYVAEPMSSGIFQSENEQGMLAPVALGRNPTLFTEPVEETPHIMTVAGNLVVGPLSGMWDSELIDLSKASGCELLEVIFALRKGGVQKSRDDWRVCHVSGYVQVDSDPVILAIGDHLEARAIADKL